MQEFIVTVKLSVNTTETVSKTEIQQEVESLLNDWIGGDAQVTDIKELS